MSRESLMRLHKTADFQIGPLSQVGALPVRRSDRSMISKEEG